MACVHLTWSLQRSPVIQALSGSLATRSSRSSDRYLLRWRSPRSALGQFTGRLYSTYSLALPWCRCPGRLFFLFSAGGHRQISTVTRFQAHPSGFLHSSRGPCSRAAGGSLLTGAILKARSAGGAHSADRLFNSSSRCRVAVLRPKPRSPSQQVIPKFPIFSRTRRLLIDALTRSRNDRLIVPLVC